MKNSDIANFKLEILIASDVRSFVELLQLAFDEERAERGLTKSNLAIPDADVKIFLVAGLEERARRRLIQDFGREPTSAEIQDTARRIEQRDQADQTRDHSPLRRPEDAVEVDTTALPFDEQVALILRQVKDLTPL